MLVMLSIQLTVVNLSLAQSSCKLLLSKQSSSSYRESKDTVVALDSTSSFEKHPVITLDKALEDLQQSNALITQDQWTLPQSCKGGTCASVAASNALLTGVEMYYPGVISKMNTISKTMLHRRLMSAFKDVIKKKYEKDFTQGMPLSEIGKIAAEVMKSVFGHYAVPVNIYVDSGEPHAFQNLDLGKTSVEVVSLGTGRDSSHAVVITEINRNENKDAKFDFVISDPHEPAKKVLMDASEKNWKIYFSISPQSPETSLWVKSNEKPHQVNGFLVFSFNRPMEGGVWNDSLLMSRFPEIETSFSQPQKYRITLKTGAVFSDLLIMPPGSYPGGSVRKMDNRIIFYNKYMLQGSFDYNDIAKIEKLDDT